MVYENFGVATTIVMWSAFALAFVMGAIVNKTNFCTMGAVSDYVNMGDTGRWRAWLFAMTVAIIGVIVMEKTGVIGLDSNTPKPNYRGSTFSWFDYLLGGLMFGIGMTLASGCGNKTLVRIGGGNIKSIFVLLIMGFFAYWMVVGFNAKTLYGTVFYPWTSKIAVSLSTPQDAGSIVAGLVGKKNAVDMRLYIGGGIALLMLIYIFRSSHFFKSFDNILGGLIVGLGVIGMWWVTGTAKVNAYHAFDEKKVVVTMSDYVKKSNWDDNFQTADRSAKSDPKFVRPDASQNVVGPQGFTFVAPSAWLWNATLTPVVSKGKAKPWSAYINVPIMTMLGVILGSLFWALVSRSFRVEWFASFKDFATHFIGAILMGIGGVLAVGCTIGQGVTGISTLALGSFIAFLGIVIGCALTMKIQYYKMLHEDASFFAALTSAMADLKLLPKAFKKLESF